MGLRTKTFCGILILAITSTCSLRAQDAAAAAPAPARVTLQEGDKGLHIVSKVAPNYPPLARQARIEGTVFLRADIDKDGNVEKMDLISGHPMLSPAAVEAVKQWKYEPYIVDGNVLPVETIIRVSFALEGGSGAADPNSPPAPRIATPLRIRVSQGVSSRLIVKKVNPVYPEGARQARIQGLVLMKALIDKEGNVAKLELISGHPMLADAAMEAVRQWKYKPYLLNGQLLEVDTQIQVNFTLSGR
jgi:TonB family protein